VELDDVRLANEAEPERADREPARNPHASLHFGRPLVRILVEIPTSHRQWILSPEPLDVDQGALALAGRQVLERGDGEEVVLREVGRVRPAEVHRTRPAWPALVPGRWSQRGCDPTFSRCL